MTTVHDEGAILMALSKRGLPLYRKKVESEVTQLCLTLCDPVDCSLPGFSIHGIFQARVLEWVAIFFSRGSSWPRNQTQVSCIASRRFTLWATRVALYRRTILLSDGTGNNPQRSLTFQPMILFTFLEGWAVRVHNNQQMLPKWDGCEHLPHTVVWVQSICYHV